jgi:type II secretory pathway component PulF
MTASPIPLRPGAVLALLASLVAGLAPLLLVPRMRPVFEAFGAELPALTRWVLEGHALLVALPVACLAALLLRPGPGTSLVVWLASALAMAVTIVGLYLPVFTLASAI